MHRLVQQVIRHRLDSVTKAARAAIAVRLIRAAFPTEHTDPDAWPVHAWLLPHVLAVTGHAEALAIEPEATAWLLTQAGLYLWHRADYQQARSLLERALAIDQAHLGADPATASVLNNLANILDAQGDLRAARTLLERALAISEARLGADHPDTVQSRQNLAAVVEELDTPQ
jgi:tetratricopeptide (TPR) repeat protein